MKLTYLIAIISLLLFLFFLGINLYQSKFKKNINIDFNLDDNWILPKEEETKTTERKRIKKEKLYNDIQNLSRFNHNTFRDKSGRFRSIKELE